MGHHRQCPGLDCSHTESVAGGPDRPVGARDRRKRLRQGVLPQIIHAGSPRKHSKYIAVNCGAIPEGTIDSELFGHEKGAFTGAVSSRKGYFEEADGGTIFLDEVAELPLTTQPVCSECSKAVSSLKVGSSTVQKTNIRIVAATNVDMARAVEEGRFREDLYYRLSTIRIEVPPLRDRGSDVTLLARKFAIDFGRALPAPRQCRFSDDASRMLMRYPWPGQRTSAQKRNRTDSPVRCRSDNFQATG